MSPENEPLPVITAAPRMPAVSGRTPILPRSICLALNEPEKPEPFIEKDAESLPSPL